MPFLNLITRRIPATVQTIAIPAPAGQTRSITTSSTLRAQFREDLKPYSSDGTQSGTNAEVAAEYEAFDPDTTNPAEERQKAGKETSSSSATGKAQDGNPLAYSGANPDVSSTKEDMKSFNKEKGEGERTSSTMKKKKKGPSSSGEARGSY